MKGDNKFMNKIIFMGTPDFAVPSLKALINHPDVEVIGVVTQPDRKVGRKQILTPPPVKQLAQEHDILVLQAERLRGSEEEQKIVDLAPDLIVTAAYGQIVSKKVLDAARLGAINLHGSLLPKYRGAAPIQYALRHNEDKTGVTLMYMVEQMDAGNMIAKSELTIEKSDDAGSLFEKLSVLARDLLMGELESIFNETNQSIPQNEDLVSYAPMIKKSQEEIDWEEDASDIYGQIRALSPSPGAYTYLSGQRFKIWSSQAVAMDEEAQPGKVIKRTDDELIVACGHHSALSLLEVQPAGKKRMPIKNYLNGQNIEEGDQFESKK